MNKFLQKSTPIFYKHFTFFWLLLSVIIFISTIYVNWDISLAQSYQNISETAYKLSNNVDRFIDDLFQEMYALPVNEKNFSDCKKNLSSALLRITLNEPKITGLLISNKGKLLCATLEDTSGLHLSNSSSRSLLGPFTLPLFDQPVYLIQQKMNHYDIAVLILASTIKNVLNPANKNPQAIALYDSYSKKTILNVNGPATETGMFVFKPLYSVKGFKVIVFESQHNINYQLLQREMLAGLLILILSYLLYFPIKSLLTQRYSLLGAMKAALKNREFYPEYQPLFDNQKGRYTGVEILLRWKQDQHTVIMPDVFIMEAENDGLIVSITLQIMEIAFEQTHSILKNYPHFHLAFNISALHFIDSGFFTQFYILVERYSLSPYQIMLEVIERDLLDKNNHVFFDKMQTLRQAGFSLAIDDYGTGHASISYLHDYPFNYIKIDKLFIHAIGTKAIIESLNETIINMAKNLGLHIIAEGVETEEQVKYLTENGVRFLQGWYFSKVLSIEKLRALLRDENESHS